MVTDACLWCVQLFQLKSSRVTEKGSIDSTTRKLVSPLGGNQAYMLQW